jgi:electron transfer flavoprotein alpha subunit
VSALLYLVEHDRGVLSEVTLGGLTAARDLADGAGLAFHAALPGAAADGLDEHVAAFGPSHVHQIHHDLLADYGPDAWAAALSQLADSIHATVVVATGTDRGNEVMAHVAAVRDAAMVANCLTVTPQQGQWEIVRVRWGGSLHERTLLDAPVKLLTFAAHVHTPREAAPASHGSSVFTPDLTASDAVTLVRDRTETAAGVTLATAPVVVSGGRGVGSPEGFAPLEELAARLGGVVGCSRVVTNNGWRPHSDQVGQTGTVVAPDLYIACGISGAVQHWVGMMSAKHVLAINTDAEAPMVTKADWAVVGDLKTIVPAILAELERRHG